MWFIHAYIHSLDQVYEIIRPGRGQMKKSCVTIVLFSALFYLTLSAESISNKNYGSVMVSEITSIYDGDTFRANIKEYPEIIGYRIGMRINGIATP